MIKKITITFFALILISILGLVGIYAYINSYAKYIVEADNAPNADCILVLGAGVVNGEPTIALADRLDNAYELWQKGKASKILVSGDNGSVHYNEVGVMKDYLVARGVPSDAIFQDHAGFNTYDSMYRAKEIFQVKNMLICTNNFHMRRSLYIARRLGIEAYGYPTPDKAVYNMPMLNAREKLAKIKAFWDVEITHRKPKFLGEAIPIMSSSGDATEN